jgi:hypothetical protein
MNRAKTSFSTDIFAASMFGAATVHVQKASMLKEQNPTSKGSNWQHTKHR